MKFSQKMIEKILSAKHIVVFTGAGVSQESGIPTFRDALTGLWKHFDAERLATPQAFSRDPDLVWGWYEWRRAIVMRCQPNPAHIFIAQLSGIVPKFTLITQNVDDLHERAGNQNVIHLHGSLFRARCQRCSIQHPLPAQPVDDEIKEERIAPPTCEQCGGRVRPDIVWFGEALPDDEWNRATGAASSCDVFFCIGTSSLVYPAASLPYHAADRGACLIQVNPVATDLDRMACYVLKGKAGEVLGALSKKLIK